MNLKLICLSLATVTISQIGWSQDNKSKVPGDATLPSSAEELQKLADFDKENYKYSVEDFLKSPNQSSFQFSPDGKYLSYLERDEQGKRHVYVKNTETDEVKKVIIEEKDVIRGYSWKGSDHLLYLMDNGGDENTHVYIAKVDGSDKKDLTPFPKVKAFINNELKFNADHIVVQMNKENPALFEPYLLNIKSGEMKKMYENKDQENPITWYLIDKDGILRGFNKQTGGVNNNLYYRENEKSEFVKTIETNWKQNFYVLSFAYDTPNPHDAYITTNLKSDTLEIVLYDLQKKKEIKKLFSNKTYDISEMSYSEKRNYEIDYYSYDGEKPTVVPVSKFFKNVYQKAEKQFPNLSVEVTSITENEDKLLLLASSDKVPGIYYLYDSKKETFKELFNLRPHLKAEDMAEVLPFSFKARDGMKIYAYLTIPNLVKADKKAKIPVLLNPHGGPFGPRDSWGYNGASQLLASRGYANLQINYRGSGGYGRKYEEMGYKQIGRKMLDDLEDGVEYVKKNFSWVDGKKIGVWGGSYGGLATLGSLVKTPDLYACGVDIVGVSNLFTFMNTIPPYWKPYLAMMKEQWYDLNDANEKKIAEAASPALNVEKITKPLYVIQGANDPRVNIDEADQIVKKLRQRGVDVPYMVKYDEGHGFAKEANRIEMFKTTLGFFAKHLKSKS